MKNDTIIIRGKQECDENLIFASWLRKLRSGNNTFAFMDSKSYYKNYHKVIEDILNRKDTQVSVAALKDEPEVVVGYAIFGQDCLHWVYVKTQWRNMGIAKDLIQKMPPKVTHITRSGMNIIVNKFPNTVYDPFI